ncbi:2-succinyl-6-hydroxy-2,4-cyclohexadiene-1-carboxylate synthase [Photobacterium aquae]|uniref:2-succinyl-6-hydroxy-2, 4-cyclohexadiene-1-carboxylate synthase n=1 Tax=Photobacterium aquae TaxID=1195763 RepID=A0A0J1GUH9_9GAMM|nr:alpha/beta fold hydrolase [Photobacterium aquae]KLV03378.1 2-succinyl-6-hydroxy-2,4-cyclohexadiene-1-carboxylate synthase [Photobacterium aquae]
MATFTVNASTMHYLDQGTGPVLVFGHSYMWDSRMWAPQIEALSQSYRCIVPDFWGHGQSQPAPVQTRTLADYADDVLALLDELEIDEFSLVGLSSGGMWATEMVIKVPSRVRALVLMDTFVGLEPEVVHTQYFDLIKQMEAQKSILPDTADFFTVRQFGTSPVSALVEQFRQPLLAANGEQALALAKAGRMIFGRRDMFEDAEMFALPTCIMVGAQDRMRPVLESQLMHDGITGSEFVLIPNAGHISNLEQPEIVTKHLEAFLAKHL